MDVVLLAQELEGAGELLDEVSDDDLVQARVRRAGVFPGHVMGSGMRTELLSLLDKEGEVAKLAVLHDEVDVRRRLDAVMQGDDMGMSQGLEDLDLAVEVLSELLVEAPELDALDGNDLPRFLLDDTVSKCAAIDGPYGRYSET